MFQRIICFGLMLVAFSFPAVASSQPKEIKIIVQYSPGGNSDRVARILESHIDKNQYRVKVEYKQGAGGGVGHTHVAGLKNSGETALMIAGPALVSLPIMNPETNAYDSAADFVAVAHLGIAPALVVVNAQTGIKNWQDFVAYTRNRPVSYGSAGIGTGGHIVSALIADKQNNFVHVPYKGPAITDLLGGQLTFITESVGLVDAHIKSGKLVPVAASNPGRINGYSHVPTLRELKINDHHYYRWLLLVANQGADPAILQHVRNLIRTPAVQKDLAELEMEPVKDFNPDQFLREEKKKFSNISKQIDLKVK